MGCRILFLYNAVAEKDRQGLLGECMTFEHISHITQALLHAGHQPLTLNLRSPFQLKEFIRKHRPFDMVFCIAEGFLALPATLFDGTGTPWVKKILEEFGLPTTHSTAKTMEVCRQKEVTYQVLFQKGIRVPAHFVVRPGANPLKEQLRAIEEMMTFPLFVKPCGGGNSICITEDSIVYDRNRLEHQVNKIVLELGELPISVETFLPGQEYTVGVIGNDEKLVLPAIGFSREERVRTFAVKKTFNSREHQIITSDDPRYWLLYKIATDTFDAVEARDILRVDIREDANGNPVVIDVNGTPTLTSTASFPYMAQQAGISFQEVITLILDTALERLYRQNMSEVTG